MNRLLQKTSSVSCYVADRLNKLIGILIFSVRDEVVRYGMNSILQRTRMVRKPI
jgi:hypothetical protein